MIIVFCLILGEFTYERNWNNVGYKNCHAQLLRHAQLDWASESSFTKEIPDQVGNDLKVNRDDAKY